MPRIIRSVRLELVLLTGEWMDAVLAGDPQGADAIGGFAVRDGWPDEHDALFLRMRLGQIRDDPTSEPWFTNAMVSPESREMIGHIGFHGPPRDDGSLELGYTVFPEHRRLGYAVEAAEALMTFARVEHEVHRFVLSISPENPPSLGMAEKMGFRHIGEQWDEEDGLEWVFEKLVD